MVFTDPIYHFSSMRTVLKHKNERKLKNRRGAKSPVSTAPIFTKFPVGYTIYEELINIYE